MDTIETIARRHSMLKKLAPALILASVIGTVAGGATTASAEFRTFRHEIRFTLAGF